MAKIYSTKYFCNTKVSGVGKIFVKRKFSRTCIRYYQSIIFKTLNQHTCTQCTCMLYMEQFAIFRHCPYFAAFHLLTASLALASSAAALASPSSSFNSSALSFNIADFYMGKMKRNIIICSCPSAHNAQLHC